jgi:hypothetical protein
LSVQKASLLPPRHRESHSRKWASSMEQQPPNPYYPGPQWGYPSQPVFVAPPPRRKVPWLVITLVALAALIVGLGGVGVLVVRSIVATYLSPTSWVYGDNDHAVFISWTENGGNLTGVWDATSFETSSSSIQTTTFQLTGIRDGNKLTMELSVQGAHTSLTGTVGFRRLTIDYPVQTTGVVLSEVLYPGNEDDYNQAASHVRQQHSTGGTATGLVGAFWTTSPSSSGSPTFTFGHRMASSPLGCHQAMSSHSLGTRASS